MSTREIGQLTPVPTLATNALFEIEQGGSSFRTSLADMLALATMDLSNLVIDTNKDWLGFDITNLGNLGVTGFIDIAEITTPTNPAANTGRLYVIDVAGTTSLFFRDGVGNATNLLLPGEVFVWTANHDANGFSLLNAQFSDTVDTSKLVLINLSGQATGTALNLLFNQTATRSLNFPDIAVNDEVVTELHTQQLSNKTLLVPIIADFSNATHDHADAAGGGQLVSTTALSDTGDIAYLNTPNVYAAGNRQDFLGSTTGTSGLNVGGIAGNPLTQVDGDIWYNSTSNILFARINGVDVDLADSGVSPPFLDSNILIEDASTTRTLRLDVSGNTGGVDGVIATVFTTNKTITIPDATDTLVGKATTDSFTNKTFDVDATGNSIIQGTPTAGQYLRDNGTEFIGSAILAADLPATVVQTDQANVYDDFNQDFRNGKLRLANPANTFHYAFVSDAIIANRNITLPLLTADDVMVTANFTQTLENKTLGTGTAWTAAPTITDGLRIIFNPNGTDAGINVGQHSAEPTNGVNGDLFYDSSVHGLKAFINGSWNVVGEVFTWTADHNAAGFDLLNVGGITINNPADTFTYIITPAAIVADRTVNLPLLTGNDTIVMEAHTATLTNKTIDTASNTITIVKADISDFPILAADIADNNVTFAKLSDIAQNTVFGRVAGGSGDPSALTATELTTIPNLFTATLKGLVPLSGGGTVNFLRADGAWADPSAGAGDMFLGVVQTVTAAKIFQDQTLQVQNPGNTFEYIFRSSAIVADRDITLPLLMGNDTFVFEAHTQTLTMKTINAANNTITNIGDSEVEPGLINDQGSIPAVAINDTLLIYDDSGADLFKVAVEDIVRFDYIASYDDDSPGDGEFFIVSGGDHAGVGVELERQSPVASDQKLSLLGVSVNTNSDGTVTNWILRINGANGNQSATIPANTTGFFQDTSNTDEVVAGDLINYEIDNVNGTVSVTGAAMRAVVHD